MIGLSGPSLLPLLASLGTLERFWYGPVRGRASLVSRLVLGWNVRCGAGAADRKSSEIRDKLEGDMTRDSGHGHRNKCKWDLMLFSLFCFCTYGRAARLQLTRHSIFTGDVTGG